MATLKSNKTKLERSNVDSQKKEKARGDIPFGNIRRATLYLTKCPHEEVGYAYKALADFTKCE